ncbi:hypothetical protein [Bradyrhizobium sp. CCGB01]|uniref:hypothetical protein n=1 Tax=Bradyrhizobium sp. CCGB01 TaxID=2949634 RepID=UPI0020B32633|nr:hypothetical protein [Bradyrhizobium sp. CCGB01]MCP3407921.1 hypothetical protein [Bradyrhizobium sp. CCGB01]
MGLPTDFDATLSRITKAGILKEDTDRIEHRLDLAAQGVGAAVAGQDLGPADWAKDSLHKLKLAVHKELCDHKKKELKADYKGLLDHALTTDGISALSSVIGNIVAAINPAFFVSTIVIYLSVWLLKRGLNQWCTVSYT